MNSVAFVPPSSNQPDESMIRFLSVLPVIPGCGGEAPADGRPALHAPAPEHKWRGFHPLQHQHRCGSIGPRADTKILSRVFMPSRT